MKLTKYISILLLMFFFVPNRLLAQEEGRNVASLEFFGKGLAYSFNYERLFKWKNGKVWHSFSVGYSKMELESESEETIRLFPVTYNKLRSKDDKNWFETGIVLSPVLFTETYDNSGISTKYRRWLLFPGITAGYRRQEFEFFSWTYKINAYLFFSDRFEHNMMPYFGLTFGKVF